MTQNTREQDIFLLAKNHYEYRLPMSMVGLSDSPSTERVQEDQRVEAARKIYAHHNGCQNISLRDVASCMVGDFVRTGFILKNSDQVARLLIELGPHAPYDILNRYHSEPGGYYAGLIAAIMDLIAVTQVFEDGVLLIPFAVPSVDPVIAELIRPSL